MGMISIDDEDNFNLLDDWDDDCDGCKARLGYGSTRKEDRLFADEKFKVLLWLTPFLSSSSSSSSEVFMRRPWVLGSLWTTGWTMGAAEGRGSEERTARSTPSKYNIYI